MHLIRLAVIALVLSACVVEEEDAPPALMCEASCKEFGWVCDRFGACRCNWPADVPEILPCVPSCGG